MRPDHPTGTKSRILFIQQYLLEHTDEDHAILTSDLISVCKKNGFSANRATIHDDIRNIEAMGTDVIVKRGKDQDSFFIGNRVFDLAEVKLLVDAVDSCRMISAGQSNVLTEKLSTLVAESERHLLTSRIYTDHRIKSDSHRLLINTDILCHAMDAGRQVSFTYFEYDNHKRRVHRHNGEEYLLSPYALIWSDDRYYAVGHTAKRNGVTTFRVDRMDAVRIIDQDIVPDPAFNPAEYASTAFKMYAGPLTEVQLVCENRCMNNIIDRFGEDVSTEILDAEHFLATATVAVGPTFYGWLVQYVGGIRILAPQETRDGFEAFLDDCVSRQKALASASPKP